jgi:hypothetical protein
MTRNVVLCSCVLALSGCFEIENQIIPLWQPSALERLGCEESDSDNAADEDRPVAVCDASIDELNPIWDSSDFYGNGSYDPNGNEIIDWSWKMVDVPSGSRARLADGSANRYGFVPDMAGSYTAELVVTNDQCVASHPCEITIKAVPAEDLWVEMFWDKPGDDMDLHLIEGNASHGSERDCFYENCIDGWNPDFGVRNEDRDDPHLDLDDIDGTGPENINIFDPAPGKYRVVVHDYPGSVRHEANAVTVKVHLGGELAFEETKVIQGEDKYVPFAEIDWAAQEVRPLN